MGRAPMSARELLATWGTLWRGTVEFAAIVATVALAAWYLLTEDPEMWDAE